MYWQEIIVFLIMAYAVFFIFKKYIKKDNGCKDPGCDC